MRLWSTRCPDVRRLAARMNEPPDPPDYNNNHERRAAKLWKIENPDARASDLTEEQKQAYRERTPKVVRQTLERPGIVRLWDWFKRTRRRNEP